MGRKRIVEQINKDQIKKLVLAGWVDDKIADFFGISRQAFYKFKKRDPQFFKDLEAWKLDPDDKVKRSLFERAIGYRTTYKKNFVVSDGKEAGSHVEVHDEEVVYPPDTTACIFWLKNRKPKEWRDKVALSVSGEDDDEFFNAFFGFPSRKNDEANN